jgi:hypothetical protein
MKPRKVMGCARRRRSALVLATSLICALGGQLFAEAAKPSLANQIKALKLGADELGSLENIVLEANRTIQVARGEVNADRAELTRTLLQPSVTTKDLEPIVRRSIEAEMTIRMAELDRQLKIRNLLGNARWASLSDLAAQFKGLQPQQQAVAPDDLAANRVVNILRLM